MFAFHIPDAITFDPVREREKLLVLVHIFTMYIQFYQVYNCIKQKQEHKQERLWFQLFKLIYKLRAYWFTSIVSSH